MQVISPQYVNTLTLQGVTAQPTSNQTSLNHEATKLDVHFSRREVMNGVVHTLALPKKPAIPVVARDNWTSNLESVHVIARNARLAVQLVPFLKQLLICSAVVGEWVL